MSLTLTALMKQRYDTAANWTAENPTLLAGEIGIESDTKKWKVGTGSTAWNSLAYAIGGSYPIVDADISATAEIAVSKLADGAARQLLQTDAAGTGVEWASNIDIPGTLDVTGAATFDAGVTVQGDLTVNGTTTTIDTTNLIVEDKNIEIGKVTTPTDITADGGGITLKGTTDKTINWIDSTDAWTLSEHVDIASAKEYRIAGVKVLDATSLGGAVVSSSLTSVGTLSALTVNGNATLNTQGDLRFADADSSNWVAFQAPATVTSNVTWTLPATDATVSGHALKSNAAGTLSWGTAGGATGGGTDDVFYENSQTVTSSYTLTTSKNALSAGPITVNAGATVTIPSGQSWSIV